MNFKSTFSAIATSALCTISLFSMADNSEKILGQWNCEFAMSENGIDMNMNMQSNYFEDGTANGSAMVTMTSAPMNMDLAFDVKATQTWYIDGSSIHETITGGSVTSLKPSAFDAMLNDNDLLPIGETQISEILELTDTTLRVASDGQQISCHR